MRRVYVFVENENACEVASAARVRKIRVTGSVFFSTAHLVDKVVAIFSIHGGSISSLQLSFVSQMRSIIHVPRDGDS